MSGNADNMRAWAVGLDMAYAVGGMLLLGAGIDWLAGTRPWWMLGLGLLGLIVGMYRFLRDAAKINRESSSSGGGASGGSGVSDRSEIGRDQKESG